MPEQGRIYVCRTSFLTAEDINKFTFAEREVRGGEKDGWVSIDPRYHAGFRRYGDSAKEVREFIKAHIEACDACREQYNSDNEAFAEIELVLDKLFGVS